MGRLKWPGLRNCDHFGGKNLRKQSEPFFLFGNSVFWQISNGFPSWTFESLNFFPGFQSVFVLVDLGLGSSSRLMELPHMSSATEFEVSPNNASSCSFMIRNGEHIERKRCLLPFQNQVSKKIEKPLENIGCCFHPESLSKDSFKRILFVSNSFRCSI